jgi:hypothetical protein
MKKALLLLLFLSPLLSFAEKKEITVEEYQNLLIKHAVPMNTYRAGMSFAMDSGSTFVQVPGDGDVGIACLGNLKKVSTILLVGPSGDYFLLEEDKVTFEDNKECAKHFPNGEYIKARIFLKAFSPLTVQELTSLKDRDYINLYQVDDHNVIEIYHPIVRGLFMPRFSGVPQEQNRNLNHLSKKSQGDPFVIHEEHIDLSKPRSFGFNKIRAFYGEEILFELNFNQLPDANLDELNEKYKNLKVEIYIHKIPMDKYRDFPAPEANLTWGEIIKKASEGEPGGIPALYPNFK